MKKANILIGSFIFIVVVGYLVFLGISRNQERENIFLAQKEVMIDSLVPFPTDETIFKYDDQKYQFSNLPKSVQRSLKKEQLRAQININTVIKDFVVRYHYELKNAIKNDKPRPKSDKELPSLATIAQFKVGEDKVNEIYLKNKKLFGPDHDPEHIKSQIMFELMSTEAYEFINKSLENIYATHGLSLPVSPLVPTKWLTEDTYSISYGDKDAPYHIVWIGHYGCETCKEFTTSLALLIQKYGIEKIKVTFVPYNPNDKDAFQYLNQQAFCVNEGAGEKEFWRYHSVAMNASDKIKGLKPQDFEKAFTFGRNILNSIITDPDKRKEIYQCGTKLTAESEILKKIITNKAKLQFIPNLKAPTAFLNGRYLDLEGRDLFLAVDQILNTAKIQN